MSPAEIGGYFELERFSGAPYHRGLVALNAARYALIYSLKARGVKKLYLPYLLCGCVRDVCEKYGFDYEQYNVDGALLPALEKKPAENEYVYIVNYYGGISDETITALREKYERIILDNVQDFFRRPLPGIDTIYSCRKYFGVPDGAYLSTDIHLDTSLPEDRSASRFTHLLGRFENTASEFYKEYCYREEDFYNAELSLMSPLTKNILSGVDYDLVISRRNKNYQMLEKALGEENRMSFIMPRGPYVYPFFTENGHFIRKKLAEQKIYIPTLWPEVPGQNGTTSFERDFVENLLPLPCDQRCGSPEMERLTEVLGNVR